jgi:hypothetical protein
MVARLLSWAAYVPGLWLQQIPQPAVVVAVIKRPFIPSQKRIYSERFRVIPIEGRKFLSIRYILV